MRRGLRILLSGIALFSLVSCTNDDTEGPETRTRYKVTFLNYDDTFLYETMVFEGYTAYYSGKLPTRDVDEESDYVYQFAGWDQDLSAVYSEITTRATYELVVREGWGPIHWA